jgi:hypothetical protein
VTELAVVLLVVAGTVALASLVSGLVRYRRVMRRPWPKVPPPADDNDW